MKLRRTFGISGKIQQLIFKEDNYEQQRTMIYFQADYDQEQG
jgi:hypothetical protein